MLGALDDSPAVVLGHIGGARTRCGGGIRLVTGYDVLRPRTFQCRAGSQSSFAQACQQLSRHFEHSSLSNTHRRLAQVGSRTALVGIGGRHKKVIIAVRLMLTGRNRDSFRARTTIGMTSND